MDREQVKQEIKSHLMHYISDSGRVINRSGNFECFNKSAHNHADKKPSAAIVPNTNNEGWKCFACGAAGDIFTAVKLEKNKDFNEAFNYLADRYNVLLENSHSKPIKQNNKNVLDVKQYDFTDLINRLHENIIHTNYYKSRGFSNSIINKYKLGYSPKGYNEALSDYPDLNNGMSNIGSYKFIIPILNIDGSCNYFIARRDDTQSKENVKTINMKKEAGGVRIFNDRYIKAPYLTDKFIFIVEGWADALSFEEVGQNAIALNSTSNVNLFLNLVKENLKNIKNRIFVIVGDNDEAGQGMNKNLREGLKTLNLSVEAFEMPDRYKDANDYLIDDRDGLKRNIGVFTSSITGKDFVSNYLSTFIDDVKENKMIEPISTGFKHLDKKLDGGFYPGLYVLGAISSLGKTTLITQLADFIAFMKTDVLFFSLEMSKFEMVAKSLSRESFVVDRSIGKVNAVTARNIMRAKANKELLREAATNYTGSAEHMAIIEGNFDTGIEEIKNRIDQHMFLRGTNPVVIIDYLQILKPIDYRMSDKQNIDYAVTELKRISRDYGITVIAISSFNRQNYTSPVSFESFKESGAVEYTADVILGLQLAGIYDLPTGPTKDAERKEKLNQLKASDPREIELVCLKNRNGIPYFTHNYSYYPKFNYFEEKD